MGNPYREITKLPFRDFTLSEFDKWAKIMERIKKNDFENANFEELAQATYYQLAMCNYHGFLFVLKLCNKKCDQQTLFIQDEQRNQLLFLELLLYQDEQAWCAYSIGVLDIYHYLGWFKLNLLNLCLKKYRPALLLVGKTKNRCFCYGLRRSIFLRNLVGENNVGACDVLKVLYNIEQNMIEANIDAYYIYNLRSRISNIRELPEVIQENEQEREHEHKHKHVYQEPINKHDMSMMIPLMQQGSNKALLQVLSQCILFENTFSYGLDESEQTLKNKRLILKHYGDIKERLTTKITEVDGYILSRILKMFKNKYKMYINMHINVDMKSNCNNFLERCIEATYNYLSKSGKNIELGVAYLSFWIKWRFNPRKLLEPSVPICKNIILEYLSHGLIFFPSFYSNNVITNIYEGLSFDDGQSAKLVQENLSIINSSIENFFWYSKTAEEQAKIIKEKVHSFNLMLSLRLACLWEPALIILGININKEIIYLHNDSQCNFVSSVSCNNFSDNTIFNIQVLINALMLNLLDIKTKYTILFDEEIDNEQHICLQEKSELVTKYGANEKKDTILSVVYDICKFSMEHIHYIKLHESYKWGGSEYTSIKTSFDNMRKLR